MTNAVVEDDERHRLTAVQGLAALSLDALSSVAYGPEAILIVLVAAGAAGLRYSLPVTGAIIVLLTALVVSYRQVIEAFPNGGGAYAVSKAHLGTQASLVAAASLIVDYVLNAAVGVSAGIEALTSAFPALYGASVWLCLGTLAIITGLNLWGVSESAKVFTVPTVAFIAAMAAVILGGLVRTHPAVVLDTHVGASTEAVGILLILRAFASGCSALTGVEAIANAVPEFRKPRAHRAQHTEVWLGILLGGMLIGLGILIKKFHVVPQSNVTVLAQLTEASLGHNFIFYTIQLITMVLLALAANTSFGGLPVLTALLARDNFLPHMFGLRADRQVHRYGVVVLAVLAAALLAASNGNTQALVPLFAVGVFIGFTLSQFGMVKHWRTQRSRGWKSRAVTVCFTDPEDEAADASLHQRWEQWHPNVPLITLRSTHRAISKPIVKYLCDIEAKDTYHKLVVLIPEVQPRRFWDYLLFNQRGVMLDRAIRRGTANVALCRLRYRLEQLVPHDAGPARDAGPAAAGAPADAAPDAPVAPAVAPPPG